MRSDWPCAHCRNCLISQAHGPLGSDEPLPSGPLCGAVWATEAGAASLEPPLNMPVMACPIVCPTADPIATPPAVAAICPIRDGPWDGAAAIGADGGACMGVRAGAGAGGGAARLTALNMLKDDEML